jgi:hypothetical protein
MVWVVQSFIFCISLLFPLVLIQCRVLEEDAEDLYPYPEFRFGVFEDVDEITRKHAEIIGWNQATTRKRHHYLILERFFFSNQIGFQSKPCHSRAQFLSVSHMEQAYLDTWVGKTTCH